MGGIVNKNNCNSLVANLNNHHEPLRFHILFSDIYCLREQDLKRALHRHPLVSSDARVSIEENGSVHGTTQGLIGWGKHVVQFVGIDQPMSEEILSYSLQLAHCDQGIKQKARKHSSYVLLSYVGYDVNPYVQYDALAIAAGVMAEQDAFMVVNLRATSCLPTAMLSPKRNTVDKLEQVIYTLLPSILYCGFVKYFIEDENSLWIRTVGADALYLPDFAAFLTDIEAAEEYFMVFTEIHKYLQSHNIQLGMTDTMEIGEGKYIKFRAPKTNETFLESEGSMLVLEPCSEIEYKKLLKKNKKF